MIKEIMVASVKEGKFEVRNVNNIFHTSIYSVGRKFKENQIICH